MACAGAGLAGIYAHGGGAYSPTSGANMTTAPDAPSVNLAALVAVRSIVPVPNPGGAFVASSVDSVTQLRPSKATGRIPQCHSSSATCDWTALAEVGAVGATVVSGGDGATNVAAHPAIVRSRNRQVAAVRVFMIPQTLPIPRGFPP